MARGRSCCTPCDKALVSIIAILAAMFTVLLTLKMTNVVPHKEFEEKTCRISSFAYEAIQCAGCDPNRSTPKPDPTQPGMQEGMTRPPKPEQGKGKPHPEPCMEDGKTRPPRPEHDMEDGKPERDMMPRPDGKKPSGNGCEPKLALTVIVDHGEGTAMIYPDDWKMYMGSKYTITDCPNDRAYLLYDDDESHGYDRYDRMREYRKKHHRGGHQGDDEDGADNHERHHDRQRREDHMKPHPEGDHEDMKPHHEDKDGSHKRGSHKRGDHEDGKSHHDREHDMRPPMHEPIDGQKPSEDMTEEEAALKKMVHVSEKMKSKFREICVAKRLQEEFSCYKHRETGKIVYDAPEGGQDMFMVYLLFPVTIFILFMVLIIKKICKCKKAQEKMSDIDKKLDLYKVPTGVVEVSNKAIEAGVGEKDPATLGPEVISTPGDISPGGKTVMMSGNVLSDKESEALAALSPRDLINSSVAPLDEDRMASPPPPYGSYDSQA